MWSFHHQTILLVRCATSYVGPANCVADLCNSVYCLRQLKLHIHNKGGEGVAHRLISCWREQQTKLHILLVRWVGKVCMENYTSMSSEGVAHRQLDSRLRQ